MKTFLIIDTDHNDFCILKTDNPAYAIGVTQLLTPYETRFLEVWETNEDPDTATDFKTVYRWDIEKGEAVSLRSLWKLFYHGTRFLGGYTIEGTFEGEEEATKELYAEEYGINPEDITVKTERR